MSPDRHRKRTELSLPGILATAAMAPMLGRLAAEVLHSRKPKKVRIVLEVEA